MESVASSSRPRENVLPGVMKDAMASISSFGRMVSPETVTSEML